MSRKKPTTSTIDQQLKKRAKLFGTESLATAIIKTDDEQKRKRMMFWLLYKMGYKAKISAGNDEAGDGVGEITLSINLK